VTNTIFANNPAGNCGLDSALTNGGCNISDDASCGFGSSTGAKGQTLGDNVNALLSTAGLQNNSGPTQTIALQSNSPAIDAVPKSQCPTTDQRGFARPDPEDGPAGACDVGAYEYYQPNITVNTLSDTSTSGNGLCSLRKAINNANSPTTDTTGGDCAVGTGNDIIGFSVSGTITIGSGLPTVANTLTIDGTTQNITIDGAGLYQVMQNTGSLVLDHLTISHGNASYGAGISSSGSLTIKNSTFSNNGFAYQGGGVLSTGTLLSSQVRLQVTVLTAGVPLTTTSAR